MTAVQDESAIGPSDIEACYRSTLSFPATLGSPDSDQVSP